MSLPEISGPRMADSRVRHFFSGKNVFITGGSGFVGLALIEKLLRSVPDVGDIYVLLRPKRGKDIQQRLLDMTKSSVFETLLKTESADVFKKLKPIAGDIGEENLGISPQDRAVLAARVNVAFHSAATLDFQDPLRQTVTVNILGTRRVIQLCRECSDFKVLVHVSSGYANAFLTRVDEVVYDAPADADRVVSLLDNMDDDALLQLQPELLGKHPNNYTFTKHLAEIEVQKASEIFPCTIVRPTMILGAWKEPVPGWTISKMGPQGFFMGALKGVVRRLPTNLDNVNDYIPVDVVVNQLLVAGAHAAEKRGLTVYHSSSSTYRPFRWRALEPKVNRYLQMYPLLSAVWYPYLRYVSSIFLFRLSAIFVHFIPAYVLDAFIRVGGGRPILVRLHTNVWNSLSLLERFIFTEWFFSNKKTLELIQTMNETDKRDFYIDLDTLDWEDFFIQLLLGVRKYLHKESEKTLAAARRKNNILLVAHIALQLGVLVGLWWLVALLLGTSLAKCAWAAPIIYVLYNII